MKEKFDPKAEEEEEEASLSLKSELQAEWLQQNAEAIVACNDLTEAHGLFSDSFQLF